MKWNLTLLMLLVARIAFGAPETRESLAYKLNLLRVEIESIAEESQQEQKRNEQFVMRGAKTEEALKEAYASAEKLNALNNRLNVLQTRRSALCEQWRVSYAHSVDALLMDAAQQNNPKQKGNIGKQLRDLQKQNQQLCPDNIRVNLSEDWKSIRIESYDGPQDIEQKILLLQDISRELNIHVARLDQQLKNFKKERKTKERAEEFIQESTLFTDNVAVRRGDSTRTEQITPTAGLERDSAEIVDRGELYTKEQQEQFELQHTKKKAELLLQQNDLKKKIAEFQRRAKQLVIP